jgi:hypothetical protein
MCWTIDFARAKGIPKRAHTCQRKKGCDGEERHTVIFKTNRKEASTKEEEKHSYNASPNTPN